MRLGALRLLRWSLVSSVVALGDLGTSPAEPSSTVASTVVGRVTRLGRPVVAQVVASSGDLDAHDLDDMFRLLRAPALMGVAIVVDLPEKASAPRTPRLWTCSGADGRFTLCGLAPGAWHVEAMSADGDRGAADLDIPVDGLRLERDVAIGTLKRRRVTGRVRHADGTAFAGYVVPLAPGAWGIGEELRHGVRPDAQGGFHLGWDDERAPHVGRIAAVVPGRSAVCWDLPAPGSTLDGVVDEDLRTTCGRVLDDTTGAPVDGAAVYAVSDDPEAKEARPFRYDRATSGCDGGFRIPHRARHVSGYVIANGYRHAMVPFEGSPLTVRLVRGSRIRGRLLLPTGTRVASDLRVYGWIDFDDPTWNLHGLSWVSASPDGSFDLPVSEARRVFAYAYGGGWVSPGLAALDAEDPDDAGAVLLRGDESARADLPVVRSPRIHGHVTSPDDRPVAGAWLRAGGYGRTPWVLYVPVDAASDAAGAFAFDVLVPQAPYRVEVKAVGWADVGHEVVPEAGAATTLDFRLQRPHALDVTLVDAATGSPVSGARVGVSYPWGGGSSRGGDSDAAGRRRIGPLRAEPFEVEVLAPGYEVIRQPVERRADGSVPPLVLRLRRAE